MRNLLVPFALLPCLALPAAALQNIGALDARFTVNVDTSYTQKEPQNAGNPDGDRFAVAWQTALGSDIFVRLYDEDGDPLTGDIHANPVWNLNNQSEPEVAMDDDGNFMLSWSDWNGNDGDLMGIFGRAFGPTGVPAGDDFQVNEIWVNSQWEPKGYARPSGFIMAWSGDPDGNAYFRLHDAAGTAVSGDIQGNTLGNNAQIDTAVAVGRDGTIFMAYVDFGANGAGAQENIFARTFDANGTPLQPVEFEVNTNLPLGKDREPRVAPDGRGNFVLVWENTAGDSDGAGIYAKRYDSMGNALEDEFLVNTIEAGDQLKPDVAADWMGNFVVTFADWSTGRSIIGARHFDFNADPISGQFPVDFTAAGDQHFGSVSIDWAGEDILVSWASVGDAPNDTNHDVFARRFVTEPIKKTGIATPGLPFSLDVHLPGSEGLTYVILASLGTDPGLPLPDGRTLHMNLDPVMQYALFNPLSPIFADFQGLMGADDKASATVTLPNNGSLVGATLYFSALTLDLAEPNLAAQLRHVTDPIAVTIL